MLYIFLGLFGFFFWNLPGLFLGIFIAYFLSNTIVIKPVKNSVSVLYEALPIIFGRLNSKIGTSKYFVDNVKEFALNNFDYEEVKLFMNNMKEHSYNTESDIEFDMIINILNNNLSFTDKRNLIHLIRILFINRIDFQDYQLKYFSEIIEKLGFETFSSYYYNNNKENKTNSEISDPYKILNIPSTASIEEIKKQYRKLSQQYHPDKFHNLPDSKKLESEIKMREINDAYDYIKKEKGFK